MNKVKTDFPHAHASRTRETINVLIACEESQVECIAFRAAGFNAYSCDVQRCFGKHPEWHIHGDVTPFLQGATNFVTADGLGHHIDKWHLIIAHPPCTYLCRVSSVHMVINGKLQQERLLKMQQAAKFFRQCLDAQADFVAVENPIPMRRAGLPRPTCYVEPWWYGHPWSKKTLYWLRNLPPLMPGYAAGRYKEFHRAHRGKYRSRSFTGVAQAMADQWGAWVEDHLP